MKKQNEPDARGYAVLYIGVVVAITFGLSFIKFDTSCEDSGGVSVKSAGGGSVCIDAKEIKSPKNSPKGE